MNAELETETETEDLEHSTGEEQAGGSAAGEASPGTDTAPDPTHEDEGNEVEVSIGEKPDPQAEEERQAPQWVRDLRRADREKTRRIKELEAKLAVPATETKPVLGPKPKLEDFDYDAEKFEKELTTWFETKRKADQEEQQRQSAAKAEKDAWDAKLGNYQKLKAEVPVKDFQEAEDEAQNTLSVVQQGIVVQGAENPALVIYAIGKNPAKAKELAAITDPVKFAFAIAKLEAQVKVTPRKTQPAPERMPSGTNRGAGGAVDSQLERLREEAARTGDYSKVHAYKTQKRKS